MTDNYNDKNIDEINRDTSSEGVRDDANESLKPDVSNTASEKQPIAESVSGKSESDANTGVNYGNASAPIQHERVIPIYVPPVIPSQTPVVPTSSQSPSHTYGGFSQKKNYEKACKKGNGVKILAIVMTALFLITATVFVTYYVTTKRLEHISRANDSAQNTENDVGGDVTAENSSTDKDVFSSIEEEVKKAEAREDAVISAEYTGEVLTRQELIEFASPSVVGIKTQVQGYSYFGHTSVYEGVGSGFVLTESGYIVTNFHVVEDASAIKVILENGNEYEAKLIGTDELSDLAVLKIEPAETLRAVVIGDSDKVIAGDSVIAIGCPSGIELSGTATSGMVSKAKRALTMTDDYGRFVKTMYVIQIDAPINPGNSGGPLLNDRGEVIGINTLKLSSGYEGIGFSLPINGVMDIVNQLCEEGIVTNRGESSYVKGKAALGITYNALTERDAEYYQVPRGVIVVLATPGGAAQKYGIKGGDIIIAYNGKDITTADDLIASLNASAPGDEVTIRVWRDGEEMDIVVVMGESA